MTPAEIETAMRPFGQIDTAFNKRHEGTGLGLPIAYALARLHGGDLRIDSQKGQGHAGHRDPADRRASDRRRTAKPPTETQGTMYRQQVSPTALNFPRDDSIERVGRIVAVTGAHAVILLDADELHPRGTEKGPEIGTLLKVDTPKSISLCMVSALSSPMPSHARDEKEMRIVEVEFIGELPKDGSGQPQSFRRGISCYPSLGDIGIPRQQVGTGEGLCLRRRDRRSASATSSRTRPSRR